MTNTAIKKKGFFDKPENYTKILGLAVLGWVGFQFLDTILPAVIRVLDYALETTIKTAGLVALLAFLTWLITSKDLHKVVWIAYGILMKKLTNIVVTTDPIAVKEIHVSRVESRLHETKEGLGKFRGRGRELKAKIDQKMKELGQAQAEAAGLQKKLKDSPDYQGELNLRSRRIQRLENSIEMLEKMYRQIDTQIVMMDKFIKQAGYKVTDLRESIETDRENRAQIKASADLMNLGKGFLQAMRDREMFDLALEASNKEMFEQMGEVEEFLRDAQELAVEGDIEDERYAATALVKMQEWEQRGQKLLDSPKLRIANVEAIQTDIRETAAKGQYTNLFDKL